MTKVRITVLNRYLEVSRRGWEGDGRVLVGGVVLFSVELR